jgi:molybdopterin converting factor small subunit
MATVRIPDQLQDLFGAPPVAEVAAGDVAAAVADLEARWPGMAERLLEPDGRPRRWVNLFVNRDYLGETADPAAVPLASGDTLWIIPAVAGG